MSKALTALTASAGSLAAAAVLAAEIDSTSSIKTITSLVLSCKIFRISVNSFITLFPDSLNQREKREEAFIEINKEEEKRELSRIASF